MVTRVTRTGAASRGPGGGWPIVPGVTQPDEEAPLEHSGVRIAHVEASPIRQVSQRLLFALFVFVLTVALVYHDPAG
jgi:voltage-gated potassium channel